MKLWLLAVSLFLLAACVDAAPDNDSCLEVVLTGTQGGPPAVNGLAGAGTLVRYGTTENQCNDVHLQFDVGRGTTMRLSELGVSPNDLDAVFLTHLHSDHTEGLVGLMQLRWHYTGSEIDLVCGADVELDGRALSCRKFSEHIGDAFIQAGEIAQRRKENAARHEAGPAGLININEVSPSTEPVLVWESGDIKVSAITTTHIAGSLAYRIDSPAGSVVIGGDAGNSVSAPPRASSTSESVELLAAGADVLVHSAIHPVFAPESGSRFPPVAYLRQSTPADLGALAKRAGIQTLVMTHLIPALDTVSHGPFKVPTAPLTEADFIESARESGFRGEIHAGRDLLTVRLRK
jgi:ribonuclease Z